MITRFRLAAALLLALFLPAALRAAPPPARVVINTSLGSITVALETRRAPITSANFLRYVDEKRFDGTFFYRAARSKRYPDRGLVQGGIDRRWTRARLPIAHEPTSRTGLRHVDGTISMARHAPGTASGNFFFTIGPSPALDASGDNAGYAAFGHVVSGMETLRRILAMPTFPGGFSELTKGQTLRRPVAIVSVRRAP